MTLCDTFWIHLDTFGIILDTLWIPFRYFLVVFGALWYFWVLFYSNGFFLGLFATLLYF